MSREIKLDVLILGGGFAGVYTGKALGKKMNPKNHSVGIVSSNNYMVFQPMLAEVVGASISPRHVVNSLRSLCPKVQVYRAEIESIDLEEKSVMISPDPHVNPVKIVYKELVVCLGAEIDLSRVPGMQQHALPMQTVGDAMILRTRIIARFEHAMLESDPELRRRLLTFIVVGGGYSGVETAGQILDLIASTGKSYQGLEKEDFKVVLIHAGSHILPTMDEKLARYAENTLVRRGLWLVLDQKVRAVTATTVYLDNGTWIEGATVISTVGNAPHRFVKEMIEKHDLKSERGRLVTNAELEVEGVDGLWAAGDCAATTMTDGALTPPTAQFASRLGAQCGANITAKLAGKPLKPFKFTGLGELAAIAHHHGVAKICGIPFQGFIAWWFWRTIYLSKLPGFERKLRVVLDWTLDLFFSRDTNLLTPNYTQQLQHFYLQENDRLFTRGEPSTALYLVRSGKVSLYDGDDVVQTLKPGGYFGERALLGEGRYLFDAIANETSEVVAFDHKLVMPLILGSDRIREIFES